MRLATCLLVGLATACFDPQYAADLACGPGGDCPPGLSCDLANRCVTGPVIDAMPPPCDPVEDTGCPQGQKCSLTQSGGVLAPTCLPGGTGVQGNVCTISQASDSCGGGFACVTHATAGNICERVCDIGGATSCPTQSGMATYCAPRTSRYGLCETACDPLTQTGCGASHGCYISTAPVCADTGALAPGAACDAIMANSCGKGSSCIRDSMTGQSRCYFHCNSGGGAPSCAPTGTGGGQCVSVPVTGAPPNFGICVP